MEKIVIVGTGPAGLTAAIYAARADFEPVVIEGMQPGGQLTTTTDIENFPGFVDGIDGFTLMQNMKDQAVRFNTKFIMDEVVSAELSGHPLKLTLGSGDVLETESLIIATGATAIYLDMESVRALTGYGVSACATCDGAFYRDVPVAVVGGGDTAAEEALFLARMSSKVYMIHRRDKLRASQIMADRVLANEKIEVIWDSVIDEVLDVEKKEVTGLRLKNVKTGELSELPVSGLFMGIGHRPNTSAFAGQIELDDQGFIVTSNTRTNVPGVFAAGDVQDHIYKQAVTAAGTGCMAALEAIGYLESAV
jgi:thioredoxin reductase (NADPH)